MVFNFQACNPLQAGVATEWPEVVQGGEQPEGIQGKLHLVQIQLAITVGVAAMEHLAWHTGKQLVEQMNTKPELLWPCKCSFFWPSDLSYLFFLRFSLSHFPFGPHLLF